MPWALRGEGETPGGGAQQGRHSPPLTQLTKQLKNMMTGVTQGYTKNLELRGIGYQGKVIEELDLSGVDLGKGRGSALRAPVLGLSETPPKTGEANGLVTGHGVNAHTSRNGPNWGQLENKIDEIRLSMAVEGSQDAVTSKFHNFVRSVQPTTRPAARKNFLVLNLG